MGVRKHRSRKSEMKTAILAAALLAIGVALAPGAYGARRAHIVRTADPAPGERLALDPGSGNYRIDYLPPGAPRGKRDQPLLHAVFVPATKIDPAIESDFAYAGAAGDVRYSYRIANGRGARQPLVSMMLDPVSDLSALLLPPKRVEDIDITRIAQLESTAATALAAPAGWSGYVTTSPAGGLRISWRVEPGKRGRGLLPGRALAGFGLPADDLPGIVLARLTGDAPALDFKGREPGGDIRDRLAYLTANNYVTRPVAAPEIVLPQPFDAAVLLQRIQAHVHGWVALRLLDAGFSARLDSRLAAAAEDLRTNQPEAAREEIAQLRALLLRAHPELEMPQAQGARAARPARRAVSGINAGPDASEPDLGAQIDPLAARVLDFDLNYVLRRMEEGRS